MSENADSRAVDLVKGVEDGLWELGCDVAVHVIALGPWFSGGVEVEAGAGAEVVGAVFAFDFEAACSIAKHSQPNQVMQWLGRKGWSRCQSMSDQGHFDQGGTRR